MQTEHWITTHCTIVLPGKETAPLTPYAYQQALWQDESRQRIVLKSRQMGVSRALACEAVCLALTRPGSTILLVSRSLQAARNLARYAWHSVAPAVQDGRLPRPSTRNTTAMEWDSLDSRIVSLAASIDAARSYSATDVYLDEAAYLPWAEEIYQSLAPTISTGGRMTVVSTPHGRGNLFHRLWDCEEGWSRHRVHWSDRPEYTAAWAEQERRRHTARSWAEEYELSFESSGQNVFAEAHLQAMFAAPGAPGLLPEPAALPATPALYFAGIDLARYQDYTAIAVLDDRGRLVWLDRFNQAGWVIQVERAAAALAPFPGVQVFCDATGAGDPVFGMLQTKAVQAAPAAVQEPGSERTGEYARIEDGRQRFSIQPFVYTAESRALLMEELVLAVERGQITVALSQPPVPVLLGEMRSFQWTNTPGGRAVPRHPPGGHDDCIQALALAWHALLRHRTHFPRVLPALTAVSHAGTPNFRRSMTLTSP